MSIINLDKLLNISAFSIERMNASLDEFDIDVDEPIKAKGEAGEGKEGEQEHGHDEAQPSSSSSHEHGHAPPSSHEHGHMGGSGSSEADVDCDECVDDQKASGGGSGAAGSSSHAHDHMDTSEAAGAPSAKRNKKKHDLSGVGSLGLTASSPLISAQFNAFMSDLLRTKAADLYRSKGVLAFVEEGDARFIFQGVHEQIQYTTAVEPWGKDEPKVSKVVFIGRDLDHDALRAGWAKCQSDAKKEEKTGFLSSLLG